MDRQGSGIVETGGRADQKWFQLTKNNTLQFLVVASVSCFLYAYFSGSSLLLSYNLQFSTLIFALDRKYMFIVCNGILAFLAKSLNFSSCNGVKQITELSAVLEKDTDEENVAAAVEYDASSSHMAVAEMEQQERQNYGDGAAEMQPHMAVAETEQQQRQDYGDSATEMQMEGGVLESEESEEDQDEEDEDGVELKENKDWEVNDASVSTEELNRKFEEFIRKMKEEIRIEAQQPLITVESSP